MRGFSVPVVATGVEELQPIKFSGAGYRWATTSANQGTNTHFISEWWHHTPDYETTDHAYAIGAFWSPSSGGEQTLAPGVTMTVQGVFVETSPGVWVASDNASDGGFAALTDSDPNVLETLTATLAPNSAYRKRLVFSMSGTGVDIPRNTLQPGGFTPGGQGRVQGSTSSLFSDATTTATLSNSGGVYFTPGFCVSRGGGSRQSVLVLGDSIGFGANDSQAPDAFGPRNEVGYVERGLLNETGALQIPNHIMCIPGQRPVGTLGWDNATNWSNKLACLELVNTQLGAYPFDIVINQHVSNSVPFSGNLQTEMAAYFDGLAARWSKPIYVIKGLSAVTSSDGYQTVVNQTPQSGYDQTSTNTGHLWPYNDALEAGFFASNSVVGFIEVHELASADTTTNRDRYAVRPFSTTLAASYTSGSTVSLTAEPEVGIQINIALDGGGFGNLRTVRAVTGSGPYTVTLSGGVGGAAASGNTVQEAWGDNIHPSGAVHKILAGGVRSWKMAQGYVPPNSAPAFTSSAITGTPEDGQVLTATYEATGFPVPTPTYQWQFAGSDISGQIGSTITLDESGMGLTDAGVISCEITLTNTEDTALAEPTIAFVGSSGAVPTFLSTISGSPESGFFDLTQDASINGGTGRYEATDQNGGAIFTTIGSSNNPTIDGTLGAIYPDATTLITRVQAAGNYTLVMTMTKDDGVGDAADAFVHGNDVRIRSGSATSLGQTVEIDGVSQATRGDLFTALDDALEHTYVISGYDRTAGLDLDIGRGGSSFTGSVRRVAIISETDAGANLAAWTAEAIAAVEAA